MGRLFDVVAALVGLPARVSFEGQAAMQLEYSADDDTTTCYPLPIGDTVPSVVDWQALIEAVLADRAAGISVGQISSRFHNALAATIVEQAKRANCRQVVLSGGCFQNRLLADRARMRLLDAGFDVYTHREVPPGDGGIALGQILGASDPGWRMIMCLGIPGKVARNP